MRILVMTLLLASLTRPSLMHAQHAPQGLGASPAAAPVTLPLASIPAAASGQRGNRALEGAIVGLAVGATATVLLTRSGGSNSLCNSSENQDALNSGECIGLAVAGGLVGAGIGALIGSRIRVSALQALPPSAGGPGPYAGGRLVLAAVSIGAPPY